jgi:large subunit ribosomal protein L20
MPRSVNHVASRNRRKKIMKAARGYFGARSKVYTVAKNALQKGLLYAYRDRKNKKRAFRTLWIARINAAARANGISYSRLIHALKENNIELNRKVLADLALHYPDTFRSILEEVGVKA